MNKLIAHELCQRLQDIAWADKIGGLVQTIEKADAVDSLKVYKFPATDDGWMRSVCPDPDQDQQCFQRYDVLDMLPDSKLRSVIYFEDLGARISELRPNYATWQSQLRLVCWLNTPQSSDPFHMQPTKAITEIISRIGHLSNITISPIAGVVVKVARLPIADAGLFSKYSYNEAESQYLMPPFQYFAIDFDITFRAPKSCSVLEFLP